VRGFTRSVDIVDLSVGSWHETAIPDTN